MFLGYIASSGQEGALRSTCFTYSPPVAYQKVMRFNPTLAGNKGFQGCFGFMGLFGID